MSFASPEPPPASGRSHPAWATAGAAASATSRANASRRTAVRRPADGRRGVKAAGMRTGLGPGSRAIVASGRGAARD